MKDKFLIIVLILLSIPTWIGLARPGYFPMHDDMQAMRLLQMEKCLKEGQVPCRWVPDMGYGYGYPQFNFYGPTPYYVMYGARVLGFSILDSVKVFIVVMSLVGLIGVYLLGKDLWGKFGGVISSLIFIYAPYRAFEIYVRGAMGELFALSLAAYLFWAVKLIVDNKKNGIILLAIAYASLLTSHNISTIMLTPMLGLWAILLILFKSHNLKVQINYFIKIFIGFFWGFLMAAYFILPAYLEKKSVHVETLLLGYFDYRRHFVSIKQLLLNSYWDYGSSEIGVHDGINLSPGIILWIFPILILFLAIYLKIFKKEKLLFLIFFLVIGWLGLFMSHSKSSLIWEKLTILHYFQFPWRNIFLATIGFSVCAGAINIFMKTRRDQVVTLGILLIILGVLYGNYFKVQKWIEINDQEKFSGKSWERQLTISIFDYLPIYAVEPPGKLAPKTPIVVSGRAMVDEYVKGTDWSNATISVISEQAVIREPSYYFPGWRVFVNNKEVEIDYQNNLGLITYKLTKGENIISTRLDDTLVRSVGELFSMLAILMIPIYLIIIRKYKYL